MSDWTTSCGGEYMLPCTMSVSPRYMISGTATPEYMKVRPPRGRRCEYCGRLALSASETCNGCGAPR